MTLLPHSIRRGLVAIGAVAVLGGAAVGIAAAQAQPATPSAAAGQAQTAYQKFIDALAQRLGTTTAKLETAIGQARTDAGLPARGPGFPGVGGPGERGHGGQSGRLDLTAAATAIGITPQQLKTELPGKSLADVAKAHNKTAADVATALKNAADTRVDQAVTAGRLTADQAAAMKTQSDTRIDQLVNQVMPVAGAGGRAGFGGGGRGGFGAGLDAAATAIGITPQQLRTELAGKSLAAVATAHNKTAAEVATALKNAAHTRIDQAVTAGRLTADQAAAQKTQVDQRIDQQMNQVVPQKGAGGPGAETEVNGA